MSELKPDSEKKEERLSDKEKVNTEKTNAEELNAADVHTHDVSPLLLPKYARHER